MSFKRHLVISEFTDAVNSRHGTDALSSYSKIKKNIIPLFYALGAIRLEFAPRSRRLACCAYAQAVSFRSLSGFVPVALHPSANSPNALTRHSPCARSTNPVKTDKTKDRLKPILCFMRLARFERATYPLKGECSTC